MPASNENKNQVLINVPNNSQSMPQGEYLLLIRLLTAQFEISYHDVFFTGPTPEQQKFDLALISAASLNWKQTEANTPQKKFDTSSDTNTTIRIFLNKVISDDRFKYGIKALERDYKDIVGVIITDTPENMGLYGDLLNKLESKFTVHTRQSLHAEEAKRVAAEEEAKRIAAEEAKRIAAEEAKRIAAEEEAKRIADEEAKRIAAEEAKRIADEEAKRIAAEEAKRIADEEAKRIAAEEAKRIADEEAKRIADEEAKTQAGEGKHGNTESEAGPKKDQTIYSFVISCITAHPKVAISAAALLILGGITAALIGFGILPFGNMTDATNTVIASLGVAVASITSAISLYGFYSASDNRKQLGDVIPVEESTNKIN